MSDGLFAGRYDLAELLGSGGMARVHKARDTRMGRTVAIKTLLADLAQDPDARRRFAREAHAAGALNHPGIVTVHDQDEVHDGDTIVPFLVMEYVSGRTLAQLVREQAPLDPARAVRITCDILDALAHAHAHGTVHRDVKPANVMITDAGHIKVTDFGIARVLDTDTRLTTAGSSIGTPSYMSPEQINGGDVDARSDIYAVGCVLTELLTGHPPFHDGNPLNLMYRHVHTAPPAPSAANPKVPAQLDALVLAALAKDPGERPADAGVFRASLWAWLTATDARTLTGPAAVLPAEPADRLPLGKQTPAADPRATYGVGTALPSLPAQPAAPESPAQPAPPVPSIPSAPSAPSAPAAPSTAPPPSAYAHPGPYAPQHTPPPNGPRAPEHPAYSRSPHLPLPPPYQPATPPPVNLGHAAAVPPVPPARGWSTRRKVLTGVAGVAVAGITVSVVLATGALSGGGHPHHDPTPGPTHAVSDALARHGGVAGSGYNGGVNGVVRASSRKGGTVRIAADYLDTSMLDPADTYNTSDWNIQRLLLRKLVDYAPAPGDKGRKLLPDLATNTGEVSPDGLTWTYHLKSGLRFQDGSPITSKDIKYGVERTFDRSVHPGGPSYFPDLLDEGQNYPGPYKDPDPSKLGLHSVTTPDDSTIVFKLAKPDSDFPYILAMSIGAPVPQAADTDGGRGFETHLVASGPYQVGSYDPGKSLHLVRNPEWSQATDPIRTQLPDAFDVKVYATQDEVEQALLDGNADLDFAASLLSSGTQQEIVDDPGKKADTDAAYSGATRFLSLQTDVAPFSNADCRKAVEFAVDRSAVRTALGGQYAGGDVATTMLPPTDDSYDPSAAPYTGHDGTPDIAAAKTHLAACGKPGGFSVTLASVSSTTSRSDAAVQAIADSLARVGITVKLKKLSATDFYDTLLDPAKLKKSGWGIAYTSWAADWPTGGGFLRELVEPGGAANYPGLRDTQLTGMVDQADDQTTPAAAAQEWTKIDARLMQDAVYVPLVYDRHLVYRGPHLTNVYQHQVIGGIDLSALGAA